MNETEQKLCGNVYLPGKGFVRCAVFIREGKIVGFGACEGEELPENLFILPGFIDKHIHGAGGEDCMRSLSALDTMSKTLAREGVTRFLPTTMTAPKADLISALRAMGERIKKGNVCGAVPIGIHLEGPFIAPEKAGAQPVEDILTFSEEVFEELYQASGETIRQVTYAPEKNLGMTKYLCEKGIIASVGHTAATAEEVLIAEKCGATSATHVFNAMTGVSHRNCGAVGGVMLSDNLVCELICDGKHVEKEGVRLLQKTARGRVCLVSDATEAKGLPEGEYHLGKNKIIVSDGLARLTDGTIAGSVLKMNEGVRSFRDFCHIPWEEAIDAATIVPAKCLGIDDKCGSIEVGKYADLVVCDRDMKVFTTLVEGKTVFSAL